MCLCESGVNGLCSPLDCKPLTLFSMVGLLASTPVGIFCFYAWLSLRVDYFRGMSIFRSDFCFSFEDHPNCSKELFQFWTRQCLWKGRMRTSPFSPPLPHVMHFFGHRSRSLQAFLPVLHLISQSPHPFLGFSAEPICPVVTATSGMKLSRLLSTTQRPLCYTGCFPRCHECVFPPRHIIFLKIEQMGESSTSVKKEMCWMKTFASFFF